MRGLIDYICDPVLVYVLSLFDFRFLEVQLKQVLRYFLRPIKASGTAMHLPFPSPLVLDGVVITFINLMAIE